jgi:deoxycytidylate deaminase
MIRNSIIAKVVKEAKKSTHRYRIGAIIFRKKKVLSLGHNHKLKGVRSFNPQFKNRYNSIHAEVDAIIKARTNLKGAEILVVRINKKEQFLLSEPCENCKKYIEYVEIKNIFYSIPNYPFIEKDKYE